MKIDTPIFKGCDSPATAILSEFLINRALTLKEGCDEAEWPQKENEGVIYAYPQV